MSTINGYEVNTEWIIVRTGSWALAKKNGKVFFIKRMSIPCYPNDPTLYPPESETTIRIKAECEEFEKEFKKKIEAVKAASKRCGTIVPPLDLLRVKSKYYFASEAVEGEHLAPEDVCNLKQEERCVIMKDLAEALAALEAEGIVHSEIESYNVIIVKKDGRFRPMLVGFDDCFFAGRPPEAETMPGSPEYYSPEMAKYIAERDASLGNKINSATDVYSLGILFYYYQTGKKLLPKKDSAYDFPFQASFDDLDVSAASGNDKFLCLLEKMLAPKPEDRPKPKDIPAMIDKIMGRARHPRLKPL